MKSIDRRQVLRCLSLLFLTAVLPKDLAWAEKAVGSAETSSPGVVRGNFKAIYADPKLREQFFLFLENVYRLYPEADFHQLIQEVTSKSESDQKVYEELLKRLPELKPFLSEVTFALPSLRKQKDVMGEQTARLLKSPAAGGRKMVHGYIEIGTPGRYVKAIRERVEIEGPVHLVHDNEPGFGLQDIVERGGLAKAGSFLPLADYSAWPADRIPDASVELVSNFIGLHHSPREKLDGFVRSIHRVLKPGGLFVLRDHDASSPEMHSVAALAHDVFNAGLGLPWEKNAAELRFFKSLVEIEAYLAQQGFERRGETLYQEKDPTKNALMLFVKRT